MSDPIQVSLLYPEPITLGERIAYQLVLPEKTKLVLLTRGEFEALHQEMGLAIATRAKLDP